MNLLMFFFYLMLLVALLLILFFTLSKTESFDASQSSVFECGFLSYFFSRFSFSVHYFTIGLIFLFLDLELCLIFPLLTAESGSIYLFFMLSSFILILILGLLEEWNQGELDWKY